MLITKNYLLAKGKIIAVAEVERSLEQERWEIGVFCSSSQKWCCPKN